ncbi:MAG TPA: hypothetical protein VN605_09810, partial [Thermoanaerobaculia bacterium]|nr:hypothetical protein [Thermoanaerobaculia bacterium]
SSAYRLTINGARDAESVPNTQTDERVFEWVSFDNNPPVVAITAPPATAPLTSGLSYTAAVSITDTNGGGASHDIAYVDWYDSIADRFFRISTAPFGHDFRAPLVTAPGMNAAQAPKVTMKASATDFSGNTSALVPMTWDVAADQPPANVAVTATPTSSYSTGKVDAQVSFNDEGQAVVVTLLLRQSGGSDFAVGSKTVTRPSIAAPWTAASFSFNVPGNFHGGEATLVATVKDASEQSTQGTAPLTILADALAPRIVSLTPPADQRFDADATYSVVLQAKDPESGIARAVLSIGGGTPVTIDSGAAGSSSDAATGITTFTVNATVPRRNADTRVAVVATAFDHAGNSSSQTNEIVFRAVADPSVPKAAWITPLDGAALPLGQNGWQTTLRLRATGNLTEIVFSSDALAAPVTLPATASQSLYETKVTLNATQAGSATITATVRDGIAAHEVQLPIAVDFVPIDKPLVSDVFAINELNAADYAGKSVLVRGPNASLFIRVPVRLKNLIVVDGGVVTTPDETAAAVTIADRLFLDADSAFDVSSKGYLGARVTRDDHVFVNDSAFGRTLSGTGALSSGSHAGLGGESPLAPTNAAYGSLFAPVALGSGGGSANASLAAGSGGGAVALRGGDVAGELSRFVIAGSIRANGGYGHSGAGAGSGGSVLLESRSLVTGPASRIAANGGDADAANNESRGGGGGRIAITAIQRFDFDDLHALVQARGGINGSGSEPATYTDGGAGTIVLKRPSSIHGALLVSSADSRTTTHKTRGTPLAGSSLTFDSIAIGPRALARFDDAYSVDDPSTVVVDPTAQLLRPTDLPTLTLRSTSPVSGSNVIANSSIVATFDAAAIDGLDHLRLVLPVADGIQSPGTYPSSIAAGQLAVTIPANAPIGATAATLRAVSRSGRSVSVDAGSFTIVANRAATIDTLDVSPASMYAGHSIDVSAAASDDLGVQTLTLASSIGTVTSDAAIAVPATHGLTR